MTFFIGAMRPSNLTPLLTRCSGSYLRESLQKHLELPSLDKRGEDVTSQWKKFYTHARAFRKKDGIPIDFCKCSYLAVEMTSDEIEKTESYNLPSDGDPRLDAACEALSDALQNASNAKVDRDTTEVKQALDNLRKAYDEAAESNTVSIRYIDVELPFSPFSPLKPTDSLLRPADPLMKPTDSFLKPTDSLKQILLARSWVKELITEVRNRFLGRRILVVGKPGSGESLGLPCLPQFA
jgi:hypothetical protein